MARAARALCAICDATNATTRICPSCREDPANDGWTEQSDREESDAEIDRFAVGLAALTTGRRLKAPTQLEQRIMLLLVRGTCVPVERWTRAGHFRGAVLRYHRHMSYRAIAVEVGCAVSFVHKTKRRYFR